MRALGGAAVFLGAIVVASFVAASVANDVLMYADALGWQAVVLLAWPALLFVWSRY